MVTYFHAMDYEAIIQKREREREHCTPQKERLGNLKTQQYNVSKKKHTKEEKRQNNNKN